MAFAITGARVWDGFSQATSPEPWVIRIDGDRLVAMGPDPSLAQGAEVFHYDGATALPGLIDAHVHLCLDPAILDPRGQLAVPEDRLIQSMAARAEAMVRAGITTARDLGGGRWLELDLRDRIGRGEAQGPRLLCAGQPVTTPGGHCHFWGGEAQGPEAIGDVVRRQVEHGADLIKVMATGGVFTPGSRAADAQFDAESMALIVARAAEHGLAVAAHCHGTAGIANAAQAAVRTIEHCSFAGPEGFGTALAPELPSRITASGAFVSPTVNTGWERRRLGPGGQTAFFERMSCVLRALRAAGTPLIASTDAGIPGVEHQRLPEALAVFARYAGLSARETLASATTTAARGLGLAGETGALLEGLCADVLVVEGDPLEDLAALTRPLLVVARGRVARRG